MRILDPFLNLLKNDRGNVAIIFSMAASVLAGAVGYGADYAMIRQHHIKLQGAADTAAIAAAKEIALAGSEPRVLQSLARNYVQSNLEDYEGVTMDISMDVQDGWLRVELGWTFDGMFSGLISEGPVHLSTNATARLVGNGAICVVGLQTNKKKTIDLDEKSAINAPGCGVYANADHKKSIEVDGGASITAARICSAGGVKGSKKSFEPAPLTDCPPIDDPLAARAAPPVGACTYTNLIIKNQNRTLGPGTYCGGLDIEGNSEVKLSPGIYVIKDGELEVEDNATLDGEYVGFYFTGDNARLRLREDTTIRLTAPNAGPMAGLLMFEDRNVPDALDHEIKSNDARLLLGTIYLPVGHLKIESQAPLAQDSAYTAIIAHTLELRKNPTLVLNSDYAATDIPVPKGLISGMVYLSE